jgi:hypothetical protein
MVKLCACVWDAELAILSRQKEIRSNSAGNVREHLALRKAMGVLGNLRRLSGFENHRPILRRHRAATSGASLARTHRGTRVGKRITSAS